jgi:hypothetical protein
MDEISLQGTVTAVSCNDVYSFSKPPRTEIMLVAGLGVADDVHAGVTVRHRSRVAADPRQPNLRQVHLIRSELHEELVAAGYEVPAGGLGENVTTAGIDLLELPVGTVLRFGPATATAPAADSGLPTGPAVAPVSAAGSASSTGPASSTVPAAAPASVTGPASPDASTAAPALFSAAGLGPREGAAAVVAAAQLVELDQSTAGAVTALAGRIAADSPDDNRPAIVVTGLRNPCQQINRYRPGLLKQVLGREPDGSVSRRAGVMAVVLRGGPIRPGDGIEVELPALPYRPLDRV